MKWIGRILGLAAIAVAVVVASQVKGDIPLEDLKQRYAGGASRFVDVGGLAVHYRDEGAGPPLLLLHGTGASLHTWDGWTQALRGQFRVIRMDLPGFGLTGPSRPEEPALPETGGARKRAAYEDDYRIEAYVEFVEAFRKRLGLDAFALAGNSLGGLIAWSYAVAHPAQVNALVLLDPAGYPVARPVLLFRLAQVPGLSWLLARLDPGPLAAKTLRDAYGDPGKITPALVERYRELSLREGNRRAFVARARTRGVDHRADIPKVRAPTLILWGSLDRLIPVEHAERFRRAIPGASSIVYQGIGHVPMEEIPERSAADAGGFVLSALRNRPLSASGNRQ
jgi:pimeloyl-ACP methyl ester carboxylesterase